MMLKPDKIVRLTPEQIADSIARQIQERMAAEADIQARTLDPRQPHPKFPVYREI